MLKNALVISVTSVAIAAGVALFGAASSNADQGGCPNAAAANGAAHANAKSAHGSGQQSERSCVVPPPVPEPTPTPPPALPPADLQVMGVFVNVPSTTTAGVQFALSAGVTVRNNGTASTVMADTTFTPTIPGDCLATPGAFVVQDRWFPVNTNVFISRSWSVTCANPGPHAFSMGVNVAIDSTQAFSDPNPANNNGAGGGSTQVN